MELEESTCRTSDSTTKPQSSNGYSPWGYKELETTEQPTLNLKLRHNKHVFMQLEFVLDLLVAAYHCWIIPGLCMFH